MPDLTDAERAVLLEPCDCGHDADTHGSIVGCWGCDDEGGGCVTTFETLLLERVGRIVAARVGEVVERVEAACRKAEVLTQESMGHRSEHWRGVDYADGLDAGIEVTAGLVRDALRAADAPLTAPQAPGGHGDASGDAGPGDGRTEGEGA